MERKQNCPKIFLNWYRNMQVCMILPFWREFILKIQFLWWSKIMLYFKWTHSELLDLKISTKQDKFFLKTIGFILVYSKHTMHGFMVAFKHKSSRFSKSSISLDLRQWKYDYGFCSVPEQYHFGFTSQKPSSNTIYYQSYTLSNWKYQHVI